MISTDTISVEQLPRLATATDDQIRTWANQDVPDTWEELWKEGRRRGIRSTDLISNARMKRAALRLTEAINGLPQST